MKQKKTRGTFTRTRRIMALIALVMLSSCEVVRTVTTTAEYKQVDDKQVVIESKTVESYVGNKKSN